MKNKRIWIIFFVLFLLALSLVVGGNTSAANEWNIYLPVVVQDELPFPQTAVKFLEVVYAPCKSWDEGCKPLVLDDIKPIIGAEGVPIGWHASPDHWFRMDNPFVQLQPGWSHLLFARQECGISEDEALGNNGLIGTGIPGLVTSWPAEGLSFYAEIIYPDLTQSAQERCPNYSEYPRFPETQEEFISLVSVPCLTADEGCSPLTVEDVSPTFSDGRLAGFVATRNGDNSWFRMSNPWPQMMSGWLHDPIARRDCGIQKSENFAIEGTGIPGLIEGWPAQGASFFWEVIYPDFPQTASLRCPSYVSP